MAMTSLVDVVFILLFFFMLAVRPAAPGQVPLQLAAPGAGGPPGGTVLEVLGQGRVRLASRELPLQALEAPLVTVPPLLLRPLPGAELQDLLDALDRARALGLDARLTP